MLAGPILSVLFKWGLFGTEDVKIASEILSIFGYWGISHFYAFSAFLVKHFIRNKHDPSFAAAMWYVRKSHLQSDFDEILWDSWIGMGECNRSNWSVFLLIFEKRRIENWKDCKK